MEGGLEVGNDVEGGSSNLHSFSRSIYEDMCQGGSQEEACAKNIGPRAYSPSGV